MSKIQKARRDATGKKFLQPANDIPAVPYKIGYAALPPYIRDFLKRARTDYLAHYEVNNGCWQWLGATVGQKGYGNIRPRPGRAMMAHRLFYIFHKGAIPKGLVLDHLCRNRLCVNPAHLEPVTNKENILRGEGPAAKAARQAVCKNGHPFDSFRMKGATPFRSCSICYDALQRKRYLGRPQKISDKVALIIAAKLEHTAAIDLARKYKVSPSTISNAAKRAAALSR